MKRHLLILLTVILAASCAMSIPVTDENRERNNFVFNDGTVTWQKVYPFAPEDYGAVRDWFEKSFTITRENETSIIGETSENTLPIQEAGLDRMAVIMILAKPCVVYFSTDFKEDRFRVKVNRIIWHPNVSVTTYGITSSVQTMDLNEIATKGTGYSSVFYNTSSVQLNTMLTYLFTPKIGTADASDDW